MLARAAFLLVAGFWVTMNVLLWQAEYGNRGAQLSAVPVSVVWQKILNAPDSSSLNIFQHGQKIGFCHWTTSVGEEFAKLDEAPPEGMESETRKYQIHLDGNVTLRDFESRLRFESSLKLSTNQNWQELDVRLNLRPTVWELHAVAAQKSVRLKAEDGESRFERVLRLDDLKNPDAVLGEFSGPFSLAIFGNMGSSSGQTSAPRMAGLHWEAHYDNLVIGHEPVRVYRLRTRLLDKYPVTIYVSRAGEILRAELPSDVVLVLEQIGGN